MNDSGNEPQVVINTHDEASLSNANADSAEPPHITVNVEEPKQDDMLSMAIPTIKADDKTETPQNNVGGIQSAISKRLSTPFVLVVEDADASQKLPIPGLNLPNSADIADVTDSAETSRSLPAGPHQKRGVMRSSSLLSLPSTMLSERRPPPPARRARHNSLTVSAQLGVDSQQSKLFLDEELPGQNTKLPGHLEDNGGDGDEKTLAAGGSKNVSIGENDGEVNIKIDLDRENEVSEDGKSRTIALQTSPPLDDNLLFGVFFS